MQNLVASKSKLGSFKIPVIKVSTGNSDMEPLKYGLLITYLYWQKQTHEDRNVAVELESLSIVLDK